MECCPSSSLLKAATFEVDDAIAESIAFVTTYMRAVESRREDRIINDPFAEPLTREQQSKIEKFMVEILSEISSDLPNTIAIRTRYLDEALHHRDPRIKQIVILGAGLDARAYRLNSLRGSHVLEIDQSGALFEYKAKVMAELHAPLVAQSVDCITSNLVEADLEANLMGHDFNPTMPTFWAMEGVISSMERPNILELLKAIDHLSAPGSAFWADIPGQIVVADKELGNVAMKYGEDNPMSGVFCEISWTMDMQASLKNAGKHFARNWTPPLSSTSGQTIPFSFVVGKKPL
ncbi:hypothetical protein CCR75_008030 [Bremia lactucae]|uniref:S-adenosyl-L-methionine-dependent methyltransferase n=1 Tax=Bremia lactucae TaxID=4779 RepID=A0A976IB19_BRELC|nr:hypothetical protein CCR75_008030 [Bremia lactucae]